MLAIILVLVLVFVVAPIVIGLFGGFALGAAAIAEEAFGIGKKLPSEADIERLKWQGKLGPLTDPGPEKPVVKFSWGQALLTNVFLLVVGPVALFGLLVGAHNLLTAWGLL